MVLTIALKFFLALKLLQGSLLIFYLIIYFKMTDGKITLIFTPLIISFLASKFFGRVDSKNYIKASFQPPGYVFMFVWISTL